MTQVIRPVDKAKNDEPKNFAFVTFQREEISRKLVCLFNIGMLPTAHTGQTGRRRHVRNKNCYQAGDVSIYHRTSTEFNRHGTGDHKRPSNGTRGPAPNGRSNWGTGPHGGCSNAKVSYNHSILHHSKYTSVHHPA